MATEIRKMKIKRNKTPMLPPSAFVPEEYDFARFSAIIPETQDFEDVLKPVYWSNVVHVLKGNVADNTPDRTGAIIVVRTRDHSMIAHLYVRAVMPSALVVQCIGPGFNEKGEACPVDIAKGRIVDFRKKTAPKKEDSDYDLKWVDSTRSYDVVRNEDFAVVAKGLKPREAALDWIKKNKG
jgi:hypothetical protein